LTEYVGLDLEMAIEEHYHEVLEVLDSLLLSIFSGLKKEFSHEIEVIAGQFPCDEFVYLPETLKLRFAEGIRMLKEAGATGPEGVELCETDDLRWVGGYYRTRTAFGLTRHVLSYACGILQHRE
jgi:aspartyl-tRNA synthetase